MASATSASQDVFNSTISYAWSNARYRGRGYEQSIPIDYLQNLNNRYEDFIYNKYEGKVLTIEVDNMDFLHNPDDFMLITDKIDRIFYSHFPEENDK